MLKTSYNPCTKSWFGPKNIPLYSNRVSLGSIAHYTLGLHPDNIIQVYADDGSEMSARELQQDIIAVASSLKGKFRIEKGDVIGIVAKNTKYLAAVVFAALTVGAPISPMDPSLSSEEIAHLFNLTRPKLIFCDGAIVQRLRIGLCSIKMQDTPVVVIDGRGGDKDISILELLDKDSLVEDGFFPEDLGDTDYLIGAILPLSGSTGPPKAVAVTQTILKYYAIYSDLNNTATDTRLCFSTLHWYSGVITLIASVIKASPRIIASSPFSAELAIRLIQRHQINYVILPPQNLSAMSEYLMDHPVDLPSVKQIDLGGSLANVKDIRHVKQFLSNGTIGNFYGMTEFFGLLCRSLNVTEKYSVGQLLLDCEVRIQGEDGQSMGVEEKGEILIKPWFPCLGYYDKGRLSRDLFSADGFIKSGDIGYFDSDGDLHIVDRLKETFKYNHFHVSPSELESVLLQLEGVAMAQVVGIPTDCGVQHLATAFIVKDKSTKCDLTAEMVCDAIKSHFSASKWLHGGVHFMPALPTTVSGKVSKRLLRDWVLALPRK